jgi:hypothetical protein
MSRSGYSDDCENVQLWQANIDRASSGKRGQAFFRDLVAALDAMPVKRLIANELGTETPDGDVCALGCLARQKGAALNEDDTEDYGKLGKTFGIAPILAQEVMYENDEGVRPYPRRAPETAEERWTRIRDWAWRNIAGNASLP